MAEKQQTEWTIADLIDFETLIREDEDADASSRKKLKKRDRDIHRKIEKEHAGEDTLASRRFLFRKWLDHRRTAMYRRSDSPGEEIHSLLKFLAVCLGLLGLLFAFGIVQGFFSGSGGRAGEANPVPVVQMVVICVMIPFILTLYGFWVALGNRLPRSLPAFPPFMRGFWIHIASPLFRNIWKKFSDSSGAETRLRANAYVGDLRMMATSRRGIFSAYFFLWVQCLSLGYAVGLPLSIAWKNSTISRDYGWSTNYDKTFTPECVSGFTKIVAFPWSGWKGSSEGFPSLEQVRASQYERYAPANSGNAEVWGVWATFLLFASVAYVSVPRFALFFMSRKTLRGALNTEPFEERFSSLYERMTEPEVVIEPEGKEDGPSPDSTPSHRKKKPSPHSDKDSSAEKPPSEKSLPEQPIAKKGLSGKGISQASQNSSASSRSSSLPVDANICVLTMSEDLVSDAFQSAVMNFLKQKKKWNVSSAHSVPEDAAGRHEFAVKLPDILKEAGSSRVVIVEDVLLPPALQQMKYLKELRQNLGRQAGIVVALFADDEENGEAPLGGRLPETEHKVWRQKLKALGDPNLRDITFHPSST